MIRCLKMADDLRLAVCGKDLVLLDLTRDHYLISVGEAFDLTWTENEGWTTSRPALLEAFAEQGRLAADEDQARLLTRPPNVATLSAHPFEGLVRLDDVLAFAASLLGYAIAARGRPLGARLARAAAGRSKRPSAIGVVDDAAAGEDRRRLGAFWKLLTWAPWQGACVYRADLLLRYLRLRGGDAVWVVGVQTWPFRAHCWLQSGGVVLTDDPEALVGLVPIAWA